ncbi:MAG: hypothetical protein WCB68_19365 [Pyrinomonadaceae bacterium]
MRIAIGADHGGFPLNERVIEELRAAGCKRFMLKRRELVAPSRFGYA